MTMLLFVLCCGRYTNQKLKAEKRGTDELIHESGSILSGLMGQGKEY
jgi:hypothetical protein